MSVNQLSDRDLKTAADFQQLVDDIESLMASPAGVEAEHVARLHADFEHAVKAINTRLRECDQLLKKGLRNEALERCESEPKLLELFLIVDFPERESWADTVRQCGLTPTDLLVSVAAELTDAYATEKPLAELKYQVRLHALARSPLPIRILLMRRLSKLDQNTTVWEEDLKVFEKARHNQLPGEIQTALKSGNVETLTGLQEELQSPDWLTPPAKGLLQQVTDALNLLRRQQARDELRRLEPELIAAFAAFDVQGGRQLRESWQQSAKFAALPASDPLLQSVAPTLQWLDEQDQQEREQAAYELAVGALTHALDKGASRLVLEKHYHALMSLGRGIPDELKLRLDERLRRLDREKSRAMWLKIAGVTVAVSLVVALGIFSYLNAVFRQQVQAQVAILRRIIDEKQLPDAADHLSKLQTQSPRIYEADEVKKIRGELKLAQEKDAVRQLEFKNLMDTAQRDGVEQVSTKSIDRAVVTLEKAWNAAVYRDEKAAVTKLSNEVAEVKKHLEQTMDDQFVSEVGKKDREFTGLKPAPLDNLEALQLLKTEVAALLAREGISPNLREERARALLAEIEQSVQQGMKQQAEARFLREINASIGDRVKYFAALDRYSSSTEFVGTSRNNDFQRVAKLDAPLVAGFQSWSVFLEGLMRRDLTTVDAANSTKMRTDAEKLAKDHPGFPYAAQLQDVVGYLAKSAARERGSPVMEQVLTRPMFKVLSVRAGTLRYYFPAGELPVKDATGSLTIKHYVDTEFNAPKQVRLKNAENDAPWHSPQMEFAIEARELLNKLREQKGANWDQTFVTLLGKLYNNPNMDPILKIQLIPFVLRAVGDGSQFLPKRLDKLKTEIERENLNPSTNWVLPENAEAITVRSRAEELLKRISGELKDVKPLLADAEQALESLKRPRFDVRYVWNGWLHKDSGNKWTCTFRSNIDSATQGGDLFVLVKAESGEVSFVRIGQVQQGRTTIDSGSAELVEGRPVFERKPDPPAVKPTGG